MSPQSKVMPKIDSRMYVRLVAVVFLISAGTALAMTTLRLYKPHLFYQDLKALKGNKVENIEIEAMHYFVCSLMIVGSVVGIVNSLVTLNRRSEQNTNRAITVWLLLDSVFETSRIVYVFVNQIVLNSHGIWSLYELFISTAQYLLDSYLYCSVVLRH